MYDRNDLTCTFDVLTSASEKKSFLLYYAVPLLLEHLPQVYVNHLMFLVGGTYRLLKRSISGEDMNDAACYLKLFCAQASALYGMYNFLTRKACYNSQCVIRRDWFNLVAPMFFNFFILGMHLCRNWIIGR